MVNYSTNINNMDNHLSPEESLRSEGQLFHPSLLKLSSGER
jgi:hypothetical protein